MANYSKNQTTQEIKIEKKWNFEFYKLEEVSAESGEQKRIFETTVVEASSTTTIIMGGTT